MNCNFLNKKEDNSAPFSIFFQWLSLFVQQQENFLKKSHQEINWHSNKNAYEYDEVNHSVRNELVTCEDSLRQEVVFVLSKNPVEVIKSEALVCTSDNEVNCWRYHYHEHCKEQV